jgi:hypothetical protein
MSTVRTPPDTPRVASGRNRLDGRRTELEFYRNFGIGHLSEEVHGASECELEGQLALLVLLYPCSRWARGDLANRAILAQKEPYIWLREG